MLQIITYTKILNYKLAIKDVVYSELKKIMVFVELEHF